MVIKMTNFEKFNEKIINLMQKDKDEFSCACCICMDNSKGDSNCRKVKCIDEMEAVKWLSQKAE